jgi:hypothetical protein
MSYIKVHLPERYELKKRIQSDKDKWIPFYAKHGAYVGSVESVDYLTEEIEKYYDSKKS